MQRSGRWAAAFALVAAGACSGCTPSTPAYEYPEQWQSSDSQSGGLRFSASQSGAVAVLPFQLSSTPAALLTTADSVAAEPGKPYRVSGQTSGLSLPSSVLDDGSAFGIKRAPLDSDSEENPVVPGVFSTDGTFQALSEIAQPIQLLPGSNPGGLVFQTQNSSAFGDWVVWREGSAGGPQSVPTLENDDWRLIGWNRVTSTVKELASAYLLHGDRSAPYATWDVAPSTDGRFVYFEASVPQEGQWVPSILSVPLDSPGETTVLGAGTNPFADQRDGGVFYVDGNEVLKDGNVLFSVDSDEWHIGKLTGSPDLLAATVANGESAWLLLWDIGAQKMLAAIETGSDWAFASVGGKTVVWGNGSGNENPTMYRWAPDAQLTSFGAVQGLSIPITNGTEVVFPIQNEGDITWQFTNWD